MKKALVSVLRLIMFVGVLALLPSIRKGPEAQMGHDCQTFQTENDPCPSCCSMPSNQLDNDIVAVSSGTGIQSILNTSYSCGSTPATCNGVACSGTYPQAVSDSGCCIASGSTCASNEPAVPEPFAVQVECAELAQILDKHAILLRIAAPAEPFAVLMGPAELVP